MRTMRSALTLQHPPQSTSPRTTLSKAHWKGTAVLIGDVPAEVAKLKAPRGKPIVVVGSSELRGDAQ